MAALGALIEGEVAAQEAVIELVTRCNSEEEFIERFARFTTETELVVPAQPQVTVGSTGHFTICLKDRAPIMKGRCEVTEIRPIVNAPGAAAKSGLALMRLRLREMDAHSAGIHLRLMERHAAAPKRPRLPPPTRAVTPPAIPSRTPPPPPTPMATAAAAAAAAAAPAAPEAVPVPAVPTADDSVTVVSDTQPPPEARGPSDNEPTDVSRLPRPETRAAGASFTLPANPLSDMDAADLASFIELNVAPQAPAASLDARLQRGRQIARRFGPLVACLIGGLLVGIALRSGTNKMSKPAAPKVVAPPAAVAPPPPPPAPTPAPSATEEANDIPDPAPRRCIVRVKTKPAGAQVMWGDLELGPSPIRRATVPCGSATVTFRRDHYAEVTRTITAKRKRSTAVVQRMQRARPAEVGGRVVAWRR